MELQYDTEEQSQLDGITAVLDNPHDKRIVLIHEELLASDFTMYNRVSYSTWEWYDQNEMNRFLTYFLIKHSDV